MQSPAGNESPNGTPVELPIEPNLRPFTVVLGIILGTVFSIAFGLGVVSLIFWFLKDEYPRLASEISELALATSAFAALTLFAVLSFIGSLRRADWRYLPLACLWFTLLLVGGYYWPD